MADAVAAQPAVSTRNRRVLGIACAAHALHDGCADTLYVLLPLWKAEFGLGYALVGLLRALYSASMAAFQRPSAMAADRFGAARVLATGTALVGVGYIVAGTSTSLLPLIAALVLGGIGASTQHPIGSSAVAAAFEGRRSRERLATYNFSGDLGKMALPALAASLLTILAWRRTMLLLGGCVAVASLAVLLLPSTVPRAEAPERRGDATTARESRGFGVLLSIGVLDSATRMGFLTFLPFLLASKGAPLRTVGVALTLVFLGGAAGKLVCGFLGARLGVVPTVILTEGFTAAGILALLPSPLPLALAILPLVGVCLNGTSSVLYGTVPELVAPERRTHAFSVFYTGTIGSGAIAPVVYGTVGDLASVPVLLTVVALLVLVTLPLAWRLRRPLAGLGAHDAGAGA